MIVVDTLSEMRRVLPACACQQMVELVEEFAEDGGAEHASFTALFGGPVKVVECVADLGEIRTLEHSGGRPMSLLETSSPSFDVAEWICGGAFARFAMIESDLGGCQFYVPSEVAEQCEFVAQSVGRE